MYIFGIVTGLTTTQAIFRVSCRKTQCGLAFGKLMQWTHQVIGVGQPTRIEVKVGRLAFLALSEIHGVI